MKKSAFTNMKPMRIQARQDSPAEQNYYGKKSSGDKKPAARASRAALATGIDPAPLKDLIFHGGKVVSQMEFQNIYLGGAASWKEATISAIDTSIFRAMRDRRLNNVMKQYFPNRTLTCDMRASFILDEPKPLSLGEPEIQDHIFAAYDSNLIAKRDIDTTIFNFILPSGTTLRLDNSSSLQGLGGYHGSVRRMRAGKMIRLYYSANVHSEILPNGRENGIVVFNRAWKNVVGTLYHEINEFRTDADVNDAITQNNNDFLGWTSRDGEEVGDQPIFAASNLNLVFKEVLTSNGGGRVPVQFMYSNAVHGAEGPINAPHV
jgi:hypothetical protein